MDDIVWFGEQLNNSIVDIYKLVLPDFHAYINIQLNHIKKRQESSGK